MNPRAIKSIGNPIPSDTGNHVSFTMELEDGESIPLSFKTTMIGRFIDLLLYLVGQAYETQTKATDKPPEMPKQLTANPVEVIDIGISPGRAEGEVILSLSLGPTELAFFVTPNVLANLRNHLNQILKPKSRRDQ